MLWFPPRAICAEIPKQLSRSDQLIKPLPSTSSHAHKSAWSFLAQEGTEVGFQRAGLLEQYVVACFVADQFQQLAQGSSDQHPPFRLRRPDWRRAGLRLGSQSEVIDGAFHHARRDSAAAGIFDGALPGTLRLFGSEAAQGLDLTLMLRLQGGKNSQMINHLGGRDHLIDIASQSQA
jgi:hypothetical protein